MQIAIRVDALSPPEGAAAIDEGRPQTFTGWLQLLSFLEQAMSGEVLVHSGGTVDEPSPGDAPRR